MSFEAVTWSIDLPIPPSSKLVLLILANYVTDESGTCYPSFETLSKKTSLSRRAVIYQINYLEKIGAIRKVDKTPFGSNIYQLNFEFTSVSLALGSELNALATSETDALPSELNAPPNESASEPVALGECNTCTRVVNDVHQGGAMVAPNTKVYTKADTKVDTKEKENTKRKGSADPPGFGELWEIYPRKVDRDRARKVFEKIRASPELVNQMLEAVRNQATARILANRYGVWHAEWKHLATWLNGKNWLDEVNLNEEFWKHEATRRNKFNKGERPKSKGAMVFDIIAGGAFSFDDNSHEEKIINPES